MPGSAASKTRCQWHRNAHYCPGPRGLPTGLTEVFSTPGSEILTHQALGFSDADFRLDGLASEPDPGEVVLTKTSLQRRVLRVAIVCTAEP
jgi:hypothetical protein